MSGSDTEESSIPNPGETHVIHVKLRTEVRWDYTFHNDDAAVFMYSSLLRSPDR